MQRVITLSAMHFPYPVPHEVPLFLAPMSGVSESPFRLLCRRFGADVVVSEFISAVGVARGIEHLFADMRFEEDRKSTRLNSSHGYISYAVFCLKKKKKIQITIYIIKHTRYIQH